MSSVTGGPGSREHYLSLAKAHEARKDVNAAAHAYFLAGEFEEAARVLVAVGRFAEAGQVLAQSLGPLPKDPNAIDADQRRRAQKAAVCFAHAGDAKTSVELFLKIGDRLRAAQVLERFGDKAGAARILAGTKGGSADLQTSSSGPQSPLVAAQRLEAAGHLDEAVGAYIRLKRPSDAARCQRALGRLKEAGDLYLEAGQPFEAAWCFRQIGDTGRFLETVTRIPRDHPSFRQACVEAAKVASAGGVLDFHLDQFFGRFVADGPQNDAEIEAFYRLGRLYETHDYPDSARDIYQRVLSVRPQYGDVGMRLARLLSEQQGSSMIDAKIRREDSSFLAAGRGRVKTDEEALFPGLPELPPTFGKTIVPTPRTPPSPQAVPEGMPGWIIAGRYRVDQKLGEGGMAAVYRAFDLELGEEVAIKLFLQGGDDPEMLQRFRQELAVCRQIAHPNVVRLYDIGTHDTRKFISMELLSGRDLGALIEKEGPLELQRAVRYLTQACAGLGAAHDLGIVHRDIKPDNFFVTKDDVLKVMDFGIAKRTESPGVTRAGFIAGTPHYMAPEQIQDFGTVTHLADVYALGVVAYQLFTGQLPFDAEDLVPLLMMQVNDPPKPLRQVRPELPEEIEELVLRLLSKEPAKRLQSCREITIELRRIMR